MNEVDEFELIRRCFRDRATRRAGTVLGIGDDAALLDTQGLPLVHATATAPLPGPDGADVTARRVFGAAFLRLAARAVKPRWATLGLTLEAGDPDRIEPFSAATAAVCDACGVELIGGDTTHGPGRATVFALGTGAALPRRAGPGRPDRAVSARLALHSAGMPESALASLVSVCADLAGRGAELRYRDPPDTGDDAPALECVIHTDAAGMKALHEVSTRRRLDITPLQPEDSRATGP